MNLLTLTQAREFVMKGRLDAEGVGCPCCGQLAKVYTRKINSTMARWLIALCWLYKFKKRWYGVREPWSLKINGGTGDVAKLAYWGLIEHRPKDPEDTTRRTSGFWKPTQRAFEFVRGDITVEGAALVYNSELLGWAELPEVNIKDCLGTKFDHGELMRTAAHFSKQVADA